MPGKMMTLRMANVGQLVATRGFQDCPIIQWGFFSKKHPRILNIVVDHLPSPQYPGQPPQTRTCRIGLVLHRPRKQTGGEEVGAFRLRCASPPLGARAKARAAMGVGALGQAPALLSVRLARPPEQRTPSPRSLCTCQGIGWVHWAWAPLMPLHWEHQPPEVEPFVESRAFPFPIPQAFFFNRVPGGRWTIAHPKILNSFLTPSNLLLVVSPRLKNVTNPRLS